ncbi:MAG: hypothetical protein IJX14_09790 [Clostridia bacterium]|nr:hypothetical protein [Clostridia bacterium]
MTHKIYTRSPLGNPHRVWRQDNFVLSTFSAKGENMRDVLENCTDAGFTMLELGWASHSQAEEALRICEELDIDLLFQDFSVFGGMQAHKLDRGPWDNAKAVADHVRPYKSCVGYYIWDEPYMEEQLVEARRVVDLFQKEDPARCPFTVAIPSYNDKFTWKNGEFAGYLYRYVNIIDPPMLSLDYYPIGLPGYTDEKQLDDSLMWCDLGVMRQLCKRYNMPLWFYYQAVNLHKYAHFEFPMVRMMMYAAVLYGAKALQQFTCVGSVIDEKGQKSIFFDETRAIHAELKKLGNTLMALDSRYVFHSEDLLPSSPYMTGLSDDITDSQVLSGPLQDRVSVGELEDKYGNTYLVILNRDFTVEKAVELALQKEYRIYEVSRETGRQSVICDSTDRFTITLAPGDAVLVRVQDAAEEAFTAEYRLEK